MATIFRRLYKLRGVPFVQNFAKLQIGTVISLGTGFVSLVVFPRVLGLEMYGLYAVVAAFAGLLGFFCAFGQETTCAIFFAEATGKKDSAAQQSVLRYFVQSWLLTVVVSVVLIAIAPWLGASIEGNVLVGDYARLILLNMVLQAAPTLSFIMLQNYHEINTLVVWENTRTVLQFALSTIFLLMGWGIVGILLGPLVVSTVYFPLCLLQYRRIARERNLPSLSQIVRDVTRMDTGKFFVQGVWITLDKNISGNLYPNLFIMILNATTTLENVALFRLALRLASLPGTLIMPNVSRLATVYIPKLIGSPVALIKTNCAKLIKGATGLTFLVCLGAAVCVPLFWPLVYGDEFTAAIPLFLVLLPLNLMAVTHVASVPLLRVLGKTWSMIVVNVIGVALACGGYYVLLPVIPANYAMAIAVLIFNLHTLLLFAYIARLLKTYKPAVLA